MTHVLYVDDSGTKEYSPSGAYGPGNTRYFVFGGLFLARGEARRLSTSIQAIKVETFGTENVEIKSNWLRLRDERERRYLRKFGLADLQLNHFVEKYYQALLDSESMLMACVVDKVHMREDLWRPGLVPSRGCLRVAPPKSAIPAPRLGPVQRFS